MIDLAAARRLADELNALHESGQSWRSLARQYPGVKPGTLCRFAKSGGEWTPKSKKILRALGLVERRRRTEMEKRISEMARATRKAVLVVKHE